VLNINIDKPKIQISRNDGSNIKIEKPKPLIPTIKEEGENIYQLKLRKNTLNKNKTKKMKDLK
jgi:hypothetical protein